MYSLLNFAQSYYIKTWKRIFSKFWRQTLQNILWYFMTIVKHSISGNKNHIFVMHVLFLQNIKWVLDQLHIHWTSSWPQVASTKYLQFFNIIVMIISDKI